MKNIKNIKYNNSFKDQPMMQSKTKTNKNKHKHKYKIYKIN